MSRARIAAALVLLALAGCATGGKLNRSAEVLTQDAIKARNSGAMRCAPRELALAEANLEFGKPRSSGATPAAPPITSRCPSRT